MTAWQITSESAHLVTGEEACWDCAAIFTVAGIYCERAVLEDGPDEGLSITYIEDATPNVLQLLEQNGLRLAASKTAGMRYWSNHCAHCGALQGDHFLYSEPGAVFFPTSEKGLAAITFKSIEGFVGFNASWSGGPVARAFEKVGLKADSATAKRNKR